MGAEVAEVILRRLTFQLLFLFYRDLVCSFCKAPAATRQHVRQEQQQQTSEQLHLLLPALCNTGFLA